MSDITRYVVRCVAYSTLNNEWSQVTLSLTCRAFIVCVRALVSLEHKGKVCQALGLLGALSSWWPSGPYSLWTYLFSLHFS